MKTLPLLIWFVALLYLCDARRTRTRKKPVTAPENNIFFERIEYKVFDQNLTTHVFCEMRPIASNVFRLNTTVIWARPIHKIWIRSTLYYKYATYQKCLINFEFEACSFLDGSETNQLLQMALDNYNMFLAEPEANSNFNMSCPFENISHLSHSKLNMSKFVAPLMPAGRYHVDSHHKTSKDGETSVLLQMYFRISDIRVWFWWRVAVYKIVQIQMMGVFLENKLNVYV